MADGLDFDFTNIFQGKSFIYVVMIPMIIVPVFAVLFYVTDTNYEIETELSVPADETRIHNFDSGIYFINSLVCTQSLFEKNIETEDDMNSAWENCDKIDGSHNFTMIEQIAVNNSIVNSTTIGCDNPTSALGPGHGIWYYCYGGIIITDGQYEVTNYSPFDIVFINDKEDNGELMNLFEIIPFLSETTGLFSCCCCLPLGLLLYVSKNFFD